MKAATFSARKWAGVDECYVRGRLRRTRPKAYGDKSVEQEVYGVMYEFLHSGMLR